MSLRTRLRRLERSAPVVLPRGEGSLDPPCPPWFDPADWASRMRISRCIEGRLSGALRPGEYLPGMDEDERRYVDELAEVFVVFARSQVTGSAAGPAAAAGGTP